MTEDSLKELSLHDLLELVLKTTDEFLALDKEDVDFKRLEQKRFELFLLNKVITTKREEFSNGNLS